MIRWYQSIESMHLTSHVSYWGTKLKRFEAEVPKHCIFGWLCDIFQPVKQSCVVWSLDMLSCHWHWRICRYKLHKWLWLKKNKCLGSQNGLPKRCYLHLPISACKKTDPVCANCFGAVASLGWRRNQMLRIRREGRRVANHDRSHVQPFSKDVTYATHEWFKILKNKESQKYKFSISHTVTPAFWSPSDLIHHFSPHFVERGCEMMRFSWAPRHCVQSKIVWKFRIENLGDPYVDEWDKWQWMTVTYSFDLFWCRARCVNGPHLPPSYHKKQRM